MNYVSLLETQMLLSLELQNQNLMAQYPTVKLKLTDMNFKDLTEIEKVGVLLVISEKICLSI